MDLIFEVSYWTMPMILNNYNFLVLGTLMGALDSTIVISAFPTNAEKLKNWYLNWHMDYPHYRLWRPAFMDIFGVNISAKRGQVERIRKWVRHLCSISFREGHILRKLISPKPILEVMDRSLEHYALAGKKNSYYCLKDPIWSQKEHPQRAG